jgi:hypothetical protein
MTEPRRTVGPGLVELVIVTAIALAVRLPHLGTATPTYDEFYHLLAARGWLQDGTFHIGLGQYDRVALFTRMVAESLRLFGDTLAAGRVPALIAGVLWVVGVFWWTRRLAGPVAGWGAGLLFALDPGAVYLSQWVRFYTLHGLLVWVAAATAYELVTATASRGRLVALAATSIGCWALALYLQITTAIALVGLGLWAGGIAVSRFIREPGSRPRLTRWFGLAGVGLLALAAALIASGEAAKMWDGYGKVPPWAENPSANTLWYAKWLWSRYALLWVLFPVALALALRRHASLALFSFTLFATGFIGVSLAGAKQERYLYFVLPYFFVIWGMGLAAIVSSVQFRWARGLAATGRASPDGRQPAAVTAVLAALILGLLFLTSDASRRTWRMVFPGDSQRPYRLSDWTMALPQLRPLADSADVVIASYILKPLYYLGRGDVSLSYSELSELRWENGRPVEFSIDWRTGKPAISSPESLERIMGCFRSGLILVEKFHWKRAILVPAPAADFIAAHTEEVPLPGDSWLRAFRWRQAQPPARQDCPPWPSPRGRRAAS